MISPSTSTKNCGIGKIRNAVLRVLVSECDSRLDDALEDVRHLRRHADGDETRAETKPDPTADTKVTERFFGLVRLRWGLLRRRLDGR
jgi:hypothetical protein